jgi:hypothetical protein
MTWALVGLVVWLPLQTPVAIAVFQYGNSVDLSRATLLLKDVVVAFLLLYALAANWRSLDLRWFDKAAVAYAVLVAVYSTVPWLLGSHQTVSAVTAAARMFALPVEAYALGRLAFLAGADLRVVFKAFVAASAVIAATAVIEYYLLPITFWSSTLDLITFERVVQGLPQAVSLWDISLLGDYGAGGGVFPRAIATFTHPVGAGGYFILPLALTVAAWYGREAHGKRLITAGLIGLTILFGLATVVTISRGAWMAGAVVVVMCGLMFHRLRIAFVCLVVVGVFFVSVPPFNASITSAFNRNDASLLGHAEAIGRDVQAAVAHVFGLGIGSTDQGVNIDTGPTPNPSAPPTPNPSAPPTANPSAQAGQTQTTVQSQSGQTVTGGDTFGLGENLYLSMLLSTGPFGLVAFLVWCLGLIVVLLRAAGQSANKWVVVGSATALAGSMASAMTSSALLKFTTAASSWVLLGLATALVLANSSGTGTTGRPDLRFTRWLSRRTKRDPEA